MTVQEKIAQKLFEKGYTPDRVTEIIDNLKSNPAMLPMQHYWNESAHKFPTEVLVAIYFLALQLSGELNIKEN